MVLVLDTNGLLQNGGRIHTRELMEERFCFAAQGGKPLYFNIVAVSSALIQGGVITALFIHPRLLPGGRRHPVKPLHTSTSTSTPLLQRPRRRKYSETGKHDAPGMVA